LKQDLSDVDHVPTSHGAWFDKTVTPTLLLECEDTHSATAQEALIRMWVCGPYDGFDTESQWDHAKRAASQRLHPKNKARSLRRELYFDEIWWDNYKSSPGLTYENGYQVFVDDLLNDIDEQYRPFVRLWALEGYSIAAAARTLGIGVRTAERWVSQIRATLGDTWRDLWF
jgi:DNA-directed RNA polymerase specialized sigma24 family protein